MLRISVFGIYLNILNGTEADKTVLCADSKRVIFSLHLWLENGSDSLFRDFFRNSKHNRKSVFFFALTHKGGLKGSLGTHILASNYRGQRGELPPADFAILGGQLYTYIPSFIHWYTHYMTLHDITLHYITLHYVTLHHITFQLHYIKLHYISLHLNTLHYIIAYIHNAYMHASSIHLHP